VTPMIQDKAAARRDLNLPTDVPVVAMIANEGCSKDHGTLIDAWAHLMRDRGGRGRLLIAGRGAFNALRRRIDAHGLGGSVRLLGFMADVSAVLSAADLVVHATHGEGQPNAVIEAMVMGRPVIGSDVPGMRNAMGPYAAGRLVPPQNPGQLAGVMASVLANPDPQSGEMARWAAETYAVERMVSAFADVIDAAVAAVRPSAA
jgi:glycosyltransferase involved in cell wall biosynthesis